jgi:16S rRNA (uracil1498-N3)-methyltransferase
MRQFLLPAAYRETTVLTVTGKEFHYLCRVRRVREGEGLRGIDRNGGRYDLTVLRIEPGRCTLKVEPSDRGPEETDEAASLSADGADDRTQGHGPFITLCQCLPKGRKLDQIVRQVTEAGVSRIVPVESAHSVTRIESRTDAMKKLERWERVAREALQQCGAPRPPEIIAPVALTQVPGLLEPGELGLFFHQERISGVSLHRYLAERPDRITYVVGPEGGLSNDETRFLLDHGFKPVYLGQNILRTETAALYALAAITLLVLEIESWKTT